ncbi:MAG: MFS transporter [Myxococcales bacterium]
MSQQTPDRALTTKALVASLIGSSIEWYDYLLYGTVASLVFAKRFFPASDPASSLLLAYASFSIPFFIRPLGGVFFSHLGDRVGRKVSLVLTLALMGVATVLIGCLPDYEAIGIAAPILLTVLRLVQGLGIGGEWGGALLLAVEHSSKSNRGFFGSVPQMGVTVGMLLGTLALTAVSQLSEAQFLAWGWRIPFILSAVLVFVGLWIRKGIEETPAFREAKQKGQLAKVPIVETLKHHWRSVLLAVGLKVVETAPFYIFSAFVISYATAYAGYDKTSALNAVTVGALVTTLAIPLMGRLADGVGRKPLYVAGAVGLLLFAAPYFWLVSLKSPLWLTVATVVGLGLFWAPITAVLGTLYSEIFSTRVRYTGVTLGYQLGAAIAGGTAPLVATALLREFDNSWVPVAGYVMLTAAISLGCIAATRETRGTELAAAGGAGPEGGSGPAPVAGQ